MENKYVTRYTRKLRNAEKAENTIRDYIFDIEQMIEICGKEPENIKANDLDDKYAAFLETLAPSSRAKKIVSIRGFFNYLMDLDVIQKNPADILEAPKRIITEVRYTPTDKEVAKMIKTATNAKTKAIVTVLANTGLRFGELKDIKLSDVEKDVLTVCGKGRKIRQVPLNKECKDAINNYLKVRKEAVCDNLFVSNQGSELDNKSCWKMVRNLARKSGIEKWDEMENHAFRRYFISQMHKKGVSPAIIQKIVGHASYQVESDHYIKFEDDDLLDAVK